MNDSRPTKTLPRLTNMDEGEATMPPAQTNASRLSHETVIPPSASTIEGSWVTVVEVAAFLVVVVTLAAVILTWAVVVMRKKKAGL